MVIYAANVRCFFGFRIFIVDFFKKNIQVIKIYIFKYFTIRFL